MPIHDNLQTPPQRFIEIDGEQITVIKKVYSAYKRPIWAEHKRIDRQKLCQVSDGKGGLKRCTENCSKCSRTKEGSVLSIDGLEEAGYGVEDRTQDVAEIAVEKILLEELFKTLKELDPDSRRICELLMDGHSKREIARIMSIPQSSFEYQFKKLMATLRKHLGKYV